MEFYYDLNGYSELVINSKNPNDRYSKFIFEHKDENYYNNYIYIIILSDDDSKWIIDAKIKSENLHKDLIKIYIQRYGKIPFDDEFGISKKCPDYIYDELEINKDNVGKIIEINNQQINIIDSRYEFIVTTQQCLTPKVFYTGVFVWNENEKIKIDDMVEQLKRRSRNYERVE